MSDKKLLEQRKDLKSKKPNFRRQDSHKKDKLTPKWRRPKGLQNKVRLSKRGYVRRVASGWGSPTAVKGLTANGLKPVVVNKISDLANLAKEHGVIIGSSVGIKKKLMILNETAKKGLTVLNADASVLKLKIEGVQKSKKEKRTSRLSKKPKPEEKKKKKEDADLSTEEKKKKEKKEKDKVLTKK